MGAGDDADIAPLCLQNRPLLDVELEICVDISRADRHRPGESDSLEFVAETSVLAISGIEDSLELLNAGEHSRPGHGWRESGAFLVGPVHQFDRTPRLGLSVVERSKDLQSRQDAKNAVEPAPHWLGVEMTADNHRG